VAIYLDDAAVAGVKFSAAGLFSAAAAFSAAALFCGL
jgi:hypothetical protein